MREDVANPWLAKARALDRYRWLLLRERHGLLGSALRFAREALSDVLFGLRARFRLTEELVCEPCDFLLLQSAPKVIALQRKKLLIEALRGRGHQLTETALEESREVLARRLLKKPPQHVPLRYYGYAAYAEWLVARHDPKILLNDRNGSLYAPFLRLALNRRDRLLVHLAHATTVESSRRLGMNDYDYYLLFGKSSEQALRRRPLRFGSSTVLLAGSHMIDEAFDVPAADRSWKTILILGVGPDKEKEPGYQNSYLLVREWAAIHPDQRIMVKCHPRSSALFWQKAAAALPNIAVLPPDTPLAQALANASVVVNFMSNAVIEAGLARRPIIYVNVGSDSDIFDQERFFGEALDGVEALQARIHMIERSYPDYVSVAEEFAAFHLAGGFQGLHRTVGILEALMSKTGLAEDVECSRLDSTLL